MTLWEAGPSVLLPNTVQPFVLRTVSPLSSPHEELEVQGSIYSGIRKQLQLDEVQSIKVMMVFYVARPERVVRLHISEDMRNLSSRLLSNRLLHQRSPHSTELFLLYKCSWRRKLIVWSRK